MLSTRSGVSRAPPTGKTHEERLNNAIYYHEKLGMSMEKAAILASVNRNTLSAALRRQKNDEPVHVSVGRKRLLSDSGVVKLQRTITDLSMDLGSPEASIEFGKRFQDSVKEERNNRVAKVIYSARTERKYKQRAQLLTYQAEKKPQGRIDAYRNLRTPISFCAMLTYLQTFVPRELFFSSDDVSILLNGMHEKPVVLTTEAALQQLKALNLSVSSQETHQKQRVVSFNCTIAGDGRLMCTVIKFADRTFSDFDGKPRLYRVDTGLYVCLYPYGIPDSTVDKHVYQGAIIPEVNSRRESLQNSRREVEVVLSPEDGAVVYPGVVSSENGHSSSSTHEYLVLACDGASGQIQAIENYLHPRSQRKGMKHIWAKYAGGCSMIQSANDKGSCHRTLHKQFHSPHFKYDNSADPPGQEWAVVKEVLKRYLRLDSFKTIWKCMCNARPFLSKSFNEQSIQHAFDNAGVVMIATGLCDVVTILSHCPHFRELSEEQVNFLLGTLPRFSKVFEEYRYIPECIFEEILKGDSNIDGIDNCPHRVGKPLNRLAVNRQRCLLLGDSSLLEHQQMMKEDNDSNFINTKWRTERCAAERCKEKQKPVKTTRLRRCSVLVCRTTDPGTPNNRWISCPTKNCRQIVCGKLQCREQLSIHMESCCGIQQVDMA